MAETSQAKPIEDVRDISAITYGFMASKALFAALDFDLFTHIDRGADSAIGLATATGISENLLLTLLTALKSLGLIVEREGRFANAPATAKFLVAGAPGDFRDYVRLVNGAFGYESFRHLTAALHGERIFRDRGFYEGMIYSAGVGGETFSAAQHSGSLGPARLMAKRMSLGDRKRLLDVGGGSGAYTLAFCAANPELRATILDFSQTVDTAKRYVRDAGLTDRVEHLAGNATTTTWPGGHDVALISYVWSAVGGADIAVLARRAFDALPSGGLVLVHDFMVDNTYEQPPFAAWYLLGSIFDNPNAVCLTPAFVEDALRQTGFQIDATEPMLPGITMLTKARKPK
ncbi:MAG: class I SAM-dependent methyltransferase [Hyphomicrobiales bacterium]|nr:class I SAM-dependent methyltransferase [Hyphomicrobiales bacterium]